VSSGLNGAKDKGKRKQMYAAKYQESVNTGLLSALQPRALQQDSKQKKSTGYIIGSYKAYKMYLEERSIQEKNATEEMELQRLCSTGGTAAPL
jgi:hypothetical protein